MFTIGNLRKINSVNHEWRMNNLQASPRRLEEVTVVANKLVTSEWGWKLKVKYCTVAPATRGTVNPFGSVTWSRIMTCTIVNHCLRALWAKASLNVKRKINSSIRCGK